MRYGSVCSGIEAATVAWHPLGWGPVWFSEIEPFPCKVLKHHYPTIPNLGNMLHLSENEIFNNEPIDLLVGGTPCQSFSIAGLRAGLADSRGNLALEYCRILRTKRPHWFVWENVPGVLSSSKGLDFRSILSGFQECGYSFAWRILDAQYFGVPQRRRRVFVVGHLGDDWRPPAAVLFEPESLRRNSPQSRKERQIVAALTKNGVGANGADDNQGQAGHLIAKTLLSDQYRLNDSTNNFVVGTIDASYGRLQGCSGQDATHGHSTLVFQPQATASQGVRCEIISQTLGTSKIPALIQATPINTQIATRGGKMGERTGFGIGQEGDPAYTLQSAHEHAVFMAGQGAEAGSIAYSEDICPTLRSGKSGTNMTPTAHIASTVRRLTPMECERLQGFPDQYTGLKGAKNSPRYSAIGNSMAVPVMAWIGRRIDQVDKQIHSPLQS